MTKAWNKMHDPKTDTAVNNLNYYLDDKLR